MSHIYLIAAMAKNRVIGNNGSIPWNIPGEQSRFRELTTNNVVIMGRKTFSEIYNKLKKPLPNRENIIVSSAQDFSSLGCPTFGSLLKAIDFAQNEFPQKDIYISGGQAIYNEGISFAEKLFLTEIDMEFEGDVFFPDFNIQDYERCVEKESGDFIPYRYVTYSKLRG